MRLRTDSCARAVLTLVAFFWVIPLWGQSTEPDTKSESEKIDVLADSLSIGDGGTQIDAKGNVQIKR
ncbi:MAG TPA: hypothetical protein VHJ56_04955, partial [Candidatus Binatia bacterium]|nr:hypothetical protein [Candidatus Binatia bacterium]